MSNVTYNRLKFCAQIVAPAITLISAILTTWGVPYTEQITATLAAVDTFLGAVVVAAKKQFDKEQGDVQ